jgi:hypothetical protein
VRHRVRVDLILVGAAPAVGRARIDLELRLRRDLDLGVGRGADRHDLIVVAMDDKRGDGHLPQVVGLIGLGEHLDAVEQILLDDPAGNPIELFEPPRK